MNTATYNPRDFQCTFAGIPLMDGVADGDFVTVDYEEDLTTVTTGAGGDSVLVLNLNQTATATVRLLAASPANTALAVLASAWQAGAGSAAAFYVTNRNGGATALSSAAAVKKIPALTGSKDAPVNEWTFILTKTKIVHAGAAR